jgi:hypothetical protein
MGIFDRSAPKKPTPQPTPAAPEIVPEKKVVTGGVLPLLATAREKLKANDVAGAMAIYEQVLTGAGERSDVLMTISADLGTTGHLREIIEVLAPRYDLEKHGAAAGFNLLQAYIATRDAESAQHLLDLLFSLQRPELEGRLVGFSNAIAEIYITESEAEAVAVPTENKINLVSISKPIWSYGLETLHDRLLARKEGRLRRVSFAQLTLPGLAGAMEMAARPEEEQGRLARAFALWLAETFSYSAGYESSAAVGLMGQAHYALFPMEWSAENLRQLNATSTSPLDYIVTGSLRAHNADYELAVRIWEVKKFRELKVFSIRYTPSTASEALLKIHSQLRTYMEWAAMPGNGLEYVPPFEPLTYLQALGMSGTLFLAGKGVLPVAQVNLEARLLQDAAQANPTDIRAQLMLVTGLQRLKGLGASPDEAALDHARAWLSSDAARTAGIEGLEV